MSNDLTTTASTIRPNPAWQAGPSTSTSTAAAPWRRRSAGNHRRRWLVLLPDLAPGTYTLREVPQSGSSQVPANASYTITVAPGGLVDSGADFFDHDTAPPTIVSVVSVTPNLRNQPVSQVSVVFSEPIDLSTFTYQDLTLTLGGTPVPLQRRHRELRIRQHLCRQRPRRFHHPGRNVHLDSQSRRRQRFVGQRRRRFRLRHMGHGHDRSQR